MRYALNILLLFTLFQSSAQNLVPNPSFENVVQCPFSFGLEAYTQDWVSGRASPDYFNTCSTTWLASVPTNQLGYQVPSSGNAYIGMLTYRADSAIYSEVASAQLSQQMTIGQTYYLSFKLSLTIDVFTESLIANNKIGIQFSTVGYSPTSEMPVNNYSHFEVDSIIVDSLNWTTVKGLFVADSAYQWINLGNFYSKSAVDTISYSDTVFGAYYYFDDICVSTDSLTCFSSVGLHELPKPMKKLIRIVDTMSRETEDKPNTLLIYIYSDGTTEKVFRVK